MAITSHHWVSAEDILEWRQRAVRKTIETWVECPFGGIDDPKGRGSTPMMLDRVEVLDDAERS